MEIRSLGRSPFEEVWQLQKDLHAQVVNHSGPEVLLLCEHFPIITMGTSARVENILAGSEALAAQGITCLKVERGGDVTYHGPGQLVGYPILDLRQRKRDVGWYMRSLEEVIIQTLADFHIESERVCGRTGVWTQVTENDNEFRGKKIASMGIRISRWCTYHGFALNVTRECEGGFSHIHPCGMRDIAISSMEQELAQQIIGSTLSISQVARVVIEKFFMVFNLSSNDETINHL